MFHFVFLNSEKRPGSHFNKYLVPMIPRNYPCYNRDNTWGFTAYITYNKFINKPLVCDLCSKSNLLVLLNSP